jgi:hypothetical protein
MRIPMATQIQLEAVAVPDFVQIWATFHVNFIVDGIAYLKYADGMFLIFVFVDERFSFHFQKYLPQKYTQIVDKRAKIGFVRSFTNPLHRFTVKKRPEPDLFASLHHCFTDYN